MRGFGETKGALMDAAERDLSREERLFKALLREPARLQSQLVTAEHPRRLGLRLEIQACEMLLGQLKPILASSGERARFPVCGREVEPRPMPAGAQGSKEWTAQAAGMMLPVVAAFENGWAVSPAREAAIRAAVASASPMRQPTGRMRINAKLNRERDLPRGMSHCGRRTMVRTPVS